MPSQCGSFVPIIFRRAFHGATSETIINLQTKLVSQARPNQPQCKVGWVVTLKGTRSHTRAPSRQVAKLNPLPMTIRLFCWYSPCASSLISESSSSASRIRSAWVAVVMIISFSDPPEIGKRVWCSEPTAQRMSWLHFTSRTQAFWWLWLLHCMVYKSLVRLCEASWESWEWAMKQMFSSSPKQWSTSCTHNCTFYNLIWARRSESNPPHATTKPCRLSSSHVQEGLGTRLWWW